MLRSLAFAACLVSTLSVAQNAPPDAAIPPALRDWRPWVSKDLDYRACPFIANTQAKSADDFVCAWPGRLSLSSTADGATFAIRWRVEAPSWIFLPGDTEHWPQQVTVNAQRQPVLARNERPALWLGPGAYDIGGRIPWRERPQSLTVPQAIGLVTLGVDGKNVAPVQREGEQVTLGRAVSTAPEADSIQLRVYRKLADGVPAQLDTHIEIAVSGQAREEIVGPALPAGFAPLALSAEWPARLDADGRLHVQVQPGNQTLLLSARATGPVNDLIAQLPAAPWPKQEIWSYEAAPRLRVTVASSAVQIDPRQAEVPADWQSLPAFALGDGAKLAIEQRSRGLAPDEANRLVLQREGWLDFAGGGWYARDHISGSMATGWRFDLPAPFVLEQATARNSTHGSGGEPLLITRGADAGTSGVEWRSPRVDLAAGLRIGAPASMAVAGWQQTFDSVQATLHFPFGYKLLGAPGADAAIGSWVAGWSLLDVFVCAIAVLLAWRLLGAAGAAAVVGFLLLGYQEPGRPLWTLIAALALSLLARSLPGGRLLVAAAWLRRAGVLLLVLFALSFVTDQVRYALYPQLEASTGAAMLANYDGVYRHRLDKAAAASVAGVAEQSLNDEKDNASRSAPVALESPAPAPMEQTVTAPMSAPPPPPQLAGRREPKVAAKASLEAIVVTGSKIDRSQLIEHYSQTTVVQTGNGAPSWTLGSTAWLSWSGPVLATQDVHLLIAPPWLVRPFRLVLVALLVWLVLRLLRVRAAVPPPGPKLGAAALLIGAASLLTNAHAQSTPSPDLLQQLRARVSEAPKCAPSCAGFAEAQVSASGDTLAVALEVHAGERVAVPLPNDAGAIGVKSVQLDGINDDAVVRDGNAVLWITVGRGVHRIQVDYAATGDKVALAFPLRPARVLFQAKGWDASGLSDDRLLTQTLTLARAHDNASGAPAAGIQQFPAYVRVERHLTLGLEWSAAASVQRLAPARGGFAVDVPLLAGEHVSTTGIKVQNGKAQVAIADDADTASWQSTLDKADTLTLTAPPLADRAEVWSVLVSPTWHVEFSGVPQTGFANDADANDYRDFEFHPLPGETLTLSISRPAVASGALRAIDSLHLTTQSGQRAATHVLNFVLRASQGGEQSITLPKDAEVLAVSRDNVALNLRALDGKLSLPVVPGTQRFEVRLHTPQAIGFSARTPSIVLGEAAANVALTLQLPADRWLLAAFGPAVGPAVLYWGELIVMVALAYALSRVRRTRLKFRDWLLLGLGFSTFSWVALMLVVAWLFAFDWRARAELPAARWQFNLLQIALALLTLFALVCLVSAIPQGLLGQPDMHVAGNGSNGVWLNWFADRSDGILPTASAISLPLWVYKVLMLAWAVWLANALIGWLRDALAAWTRDGYWRGRKTIAEIDGQAPAQTSPQAP